VTWVILAFFVGGLMGFFVAALLAAASDREWQTAYLNCRDQLWRVQKDQEGA
jgi:hypothetical protein